MKKTGPNFISHSWFLQKKDQCDPPHTNNFYQAYDVTKLTPLFQIEHPVHYSTIGKKYNFVPSDISFALYTYLKVSERYSNISNCQ